MVSELLNLQIVIRGNQRIWMLLASVVLPSIAPSAAGIQLCLSNALVDSLPALYWHEMEDSSHLAVFFFAAYSWMFLLPGFLVFAYHKGDMYLFCPPLLVEKANEAIKYKAILVWKAWHGCKNRVRTMEPMRLQGSGCVEP